MYYIIYVGRPVESIIRAILDSNSLSFTGFIIDGNISADEIEKDRECFYLYGLTEYGFSDIKKLSPDLLLAPYYTRLIESDLLDKYLFINIHGGILPKWRGFSSNLWALLNGEKKVGYTVHRIRKGMDCGEIYKIIDVPVTENDKFFDLRNKIRKRLCEQIEEILCGIIDGTICPIIQSNEGVVYNCKLRSSDGEIYDWNKPTSYFIALWQIFNIPPHGTGTKMCIDGKPYYIGKIKTAPEIASYLGIPGAVVNRYDDGSILIKTADTAVRIYELFDMDMNLVIPSDVAKIGKRL